MDNLDLYNKVRSVPKEAQKTITAGRLKGMTDINPMWRIQKLTEQFGVAGVGWYYDITNRWLEDGADGEKCAFVEISLYINDGGNWSKPINGTGGSKFIANESKGKYTSDEAYKMALTDAISVACKALGMGADVYWQGGRTKYTASENEQNNKENLKQKPSKQENSKQENPKQEAPKQENPKQGNSKIPPLDECIKCLMMWYKGENLEKLLSKHNVSQISDLNSAVIYDVYQKVMAKYQKNENV